MLSFVPIGETDCFRRDDNLIQGLPLIISEPHEAVRNVYWLIV